MGCCLINTTPADLDSCTGDHRDFLERMRPGRRSELSTPRHRVFAIALATIYAAAACSGDAANGATSYQQPSPAGEDAGRTPDGPAVDLAGTPRLQPGIPQCAGFEARPDAAECLRSMPGDETSRLARGFTPPAGRG